MGATRWKYQGVRCAHAFSYYLAGLDLGPFFDWARALGCNCLHTYLALSWGKPKPLNPKDWRSDEFLKHVSSFAALVNDKGFVFEPACVADGAKLGLDEAFQLFFLAGVQEALRDRVCLIECYNEPQFNQNAGDVKPERTQPEARYNPTALGLYPDPCDTAFHSLDDVTLHSERLDAVEKTAKGAIEIARLGTPVGLAPCHKPVRINEPFGIARDRDGTRRRNEPQVVADFFGTAHLFGPGAAIFCQSIGIDGVLPRADLEQECCEAAALMWRTVDPDAETGVYVGGNSPELCPVVHKDEWRQRTYAMLRPGRADVMLLRNSQRAEPANGYRIVERKGLHENYIILEK